MNGLIQQLMVGELVNVCELVESLPCVILLNSASGTISCHLTLRRPAIQSSSDAVFLLLLHFLVSRTNLCCRKLFSKRY